MIAASKKLVNAENKDNYNVMDEKLKVDPFKHCPYFGDGADTREQVLKHLSTFDHFASFGIDQEYCQYKNNCVHYQRVLQRSAGLNNNNNNDTDDDKCTNIIFTDKKHLYLHYHGGTQKRDCWAVDNKINGKSYAYFDYEPKGYVSLQNRYNRCCILMHPSMSVNVDFFGAIKIIRLLKEIVGNGYIRDLLPKTKVNPLYGDKTYILNQLESMMNQYLHLMIANKKSNMNTKSTLESVYQIVKQFDQFYSNAFGIFKKVEEKMNDKKRRQLGWPLLKWQILALVLYCDGDCNYDLCLTQRNGDNIKKWPIFDCLVNAAIDLLSRFEEHWQNIYSGICGVAYQFVTKPNQPNIVNVLHLRTNVSFSSDINVAKEFRAASGMIIGLNMKRSISVAKGSFYACDVSWISSQPREKEILCARGSEIHVYFNKMHEIENKQWFVCDEGNLQETSFPSMFLP